MRKISESRKLLGSVPTTPLKELSGLYKGLMKTHHPDKFTDAVQREEAEATSRKIIEAYHFLVSIHPETHATNAEEFEKTVASTITNWHYKSLTLHLTFGDGSVYEYYGVQPNTYKKFLNTDGNTRFARRHIFGDHQHRKVTGAKTE